MLSIAAVANGETNTALPSATTQLERKTRFWRSSHPWDEKKRSAMGAAGPEIAARFERSAQIKRYADGLKKLAGESV